MCSGYVFPFLICIWIYFCWGVVEKLCMLYWSSAIHRAVHFLLCMVLFLFLASCHGIGVFFGFMCLPPVAPSLVMCFFLSSCEGSHRGEVYQEFQPSYDIFLRWCQGLFRPQVPCTLLHCPIANSVSTQNQQPV